MTLKLPNTRHNTIIENHFIAFVCNYCIFAEDDVQQSGTNGSLYYSLLSIHSLHECIITVAYHFHQIS
jgi:hypothetical protein